MSGTRTCRHCGEPVAGPQTACDGCRELEAAVSRNPAAALSALAVATRRGTAQGARRDVGLEVAENAAATVLQQVCFLTALASSVLGPHAGGGEKHANCALCSEGFRTADDNERLGLGLPVDDRRLGVAMSFIELGFFSLLGQLAAGATSGAVEAWLRAQAERGDVTVTKETIRERACSALRVSSEVLESLERGNETTN